MKSNELSHRLTPHAIALALPLFLIGFMSPLCPAAESVAVDGRKVTVETERFRVTFDGLRLTRLENRLTDEVYSNQAEVDEQAAAKAGTPGVAIQSLRPGGGTELYGVADRTQISTTRENGGATIIYSGLQCGENFDPGLTAILTLGIDPATGDLLIRPQVKAEIEQVHGVRDRGVRLARVQMTGLAENLRLVVPASDGFSWTRHDVKDGWAGGWGWPKGWEAALLIGESAKGSFGVWADEPELRYGRALGLSWGAGWNVGLSYETTEVLENCIEIQGAAWRLNVFAGNWLKPAARYRSQMEKQWGLKPLKSSTPAWADKIRIFTSPTPGPADVEKLAALVPRDTVAVFTCQEWIEGWNSGEIHKLAEGMMYFPNWPFDNPTHYGATKGTPEMFSTLEEMGIHVFPYTNPHWFCHGKHPWTRTIGGRTTMSHKIWQRMQAELWDDIVKRYAVSGIYEDCSWVGSLRSIQGNPDGETQFRGAVSMRNYFHTLRPEVAVCGERNNEVSWRGQQFALGITQWPAQAHPIITYLCSPYLRMWNLDLKPENFRADDVRGWTVTHWPRGLWNENVIQDQRILLERGIVFAREQLENYWPETWDPKVLHYFKSAKGEEFRFLDDHGVRFVKLAADGPETLYWYLTGTSEAEIGDMGIEGWIGYDGKRAIGLKPRATYCVFNGIERCPVTITSIPEGVHISRTVVRDGFWVVNLAFHDAKAEPREITVRVRTAGPDVLGFCGAAASKKISPIEHEVKVSIPGGLGTYWIDPGPSGESANLLDLLSQYTVHTRSSGLVARYAKKSRGGTLFRAPSPMPRIEEGTMPWLFSIPDFLLDDKLFLQFTYGSGHPYGDGANYMVRINGKQVWKRYRPEQGPPLDKDHPDKPSPVPLQSGQVDLTPWLGQTVVMELVCDGAGSPVSEAIIWHRPRISSKPDHMAETDDAGPEDKTLLNQFLLND